MRIDVQRPAVCTARHNRVREQAPAFASVLHDASAIISVKLAGDLSSHESSGHHQSMETPPLHVLLALDAQILGGEVGYGTSTPSDPVVSLTTSAPHERGRRDGRAGAPRAHEEARSFRCRRSGRGARADGDDVEVLGRHLEQAEATVGGAVRRRERQGAQPRLLRHPGGRGARRQRRDPRSSSRRPTSAPHEPGRRRAAGAACAAAKDEEAPPRRSRRHAVDAPPPRLRTHSHHLTRAPRPRTPAPSRFYFHPQSRRAG